MHGFANCSKIPSQSVNVRLWKLGEYLSPETGVPSLIDPAWIKGQLALTTVSIGCNKMKLWAIVDLAKVYHLDMIWDIHTNPLLQ
jgi:hypothetical protein